MDVHRHWLALNRCTSFSASEIVELVRLGVAPRNLISDPAAELERLGVASHAPIQSFAADWRGVEADLELLAGSAQRHLIPYDSPHYPRLLREISSPPPVLFVDGNPALLAAPQVAIVGSRQPTPYGIDNAHRFARELAGCGVVVTSGLARGIDAAAHDGALSVRGATVAVMATGIDTVYPRAHHALARRISATGALVTEFGSGTAPLRQHFPRRNRIISGLSVAVLVVEAKLPSGSLTTARHALEQGREVFAIPGAIGNPLARGCHALLRDGATLAESSGDILATVAPQLRPIIAPDPASPRAMHDARSQSVLDAIGHECAPFDTIVARSGLTAPEVSSILSALEIQGAIAAMPGARYARAADRRNSTNVAGAYSAS